MDSETIKAYYRALPESGTTLTDNRYVLDFHAAFDWVSDVEDATPDSLEAAKVTQQKLKEQHNVDTQLVKIDDDPELMLPKYVVCRKIS
jgi:hypothetical protein